MSGYQCACQVEEEQTQWTAELASEIVDCRESKLVPFSLRTQNIELTLCELPGRGLSFQIWPAADALCWFLEEIFGRGGMVLGQLSHFRQNLCSSNLRQTFDKSGTLFNFGPQIDTNGMTRVSCFEEESMRSTTAENGQGPLLGSSTSQNALNSQGQRSVAAVEGRESPWRVRGEAFSLSSQHACANSNGSSGALAQQHTCRNTSYGVFCNKEREASIMRNVTLSYGHASNLSLPLRVLELGAGTGKVGILSAVLGAQATITDMPHVISNLLRNALLNEQTIRASGNGGSLSVQTLRWGNQDDMHTVGRNFDIILASDVVYYDHLFEPLLCTLQWLLLGKEVDKRHQYSLSQEHVSEHSALPCVLLSHVRRWKKDSQFFKKASKLFDVRQVHRYSHPANSRTGVVIYRITAKR